MAKFKNVETDTLQGAFIAWLAAIIAGDPETGATMSETEIWAAIREERNARLRECDWVLIEDSPKSSDEKKLWKTYRQALRDLPQAYGKPAEIVWPERPKETEM
jgi:hypothetical protein